MTFVIDASIAASWAFEDEYEDLASYVLERLQTGEAYVPSLWWFEVRNTLVMGERRTRITEEKTIAFLQALGRLSVLIDRAPDEIAVLNLARQHRLTVYDATYLELARREGLPLATLDKALARAAIDAQVPLLRVP